VKVFGWFPSPIIFFQNMGINGAEDAVDMNIYTEGRQLRAPGCAKHGVHNEPEVPFDLITRNPIDNIWI
jgi:hypothetical protein